jgi:HD superfamily phosphohydrolase
LAGFLFAVSGFPFCILQALMLIRDPIHGDINLSRLATALVDEADVQRLRGIKQLGTASLVYPGCVHTRFDHSLGASAMAHRIVASIRRLGTTVSVDCEDLIAAAALLHDITHVPFGHTLEDERRLFPRHDKGSRLERLLDGALGIALDRLGARAELAGLLGAGPMTLPPWAADIVASTIDADLLDYLRRDSYFAGLAQSYDDRVLRYFTVADDRLALAMTKHGMERPDARSEVVQVLRLRYFLTERVYYHHTKVAAGAMISKAVELAVDAGALSEPDLLALNDWTLLERLRLTGIPAVSRLVMGLLDRNLLKRAYVISAHTVDATQRADLVHRLHESRAERSSVEEQLQRALGCGPGEVVVYCPALTVMKEAAALVQTHDGLRRLNDRQHESFADIHALETQYANLWRLYVFAAPAYRTRGAEVSCELFGYPSEHVTMVRM